MRLRPSGSKGPVAVSLGAFQRYQAEDAWSWERMALTRARVVAGPPALSRRIAAAMRAALSNPEKAKTAIADALAMRQRMLRELPAAGPWDVKLSPGGLVEVEFIAQALQLVHAPARPTVLDTNTIGALIMLKGAGALPAQDADTLIASARLQHALTQVLRIALDETPKIEEATPGLKALLTRAAEVESFAQAQKLLAQLQGQTREIFSRLLAAQ